MRASPLLVLALVACGGPAGAGDAGVDAAPRAVEVAPRVDTSVHAHAATADGPRVHVPAGTVLAGSRPGTAWRRPSLEADLAAIDVPAFEIDRHVETSVGRADPQRVSARDAEATCASRGGRLCDELEWERACEGDAHTAWPTADFAGCAARPAACIAQTGVVAPGVAAPEWTRSGDQFVLRGARDDQDAPLHRCDARVPLADPADREAAIRCCYGPAPTLSYPRTNGSRPFSALEIDLESLRAAMRSTPELAPWADDFTPFDVAGAERAYTRADLLVDDTIRARLAPGPLVWSPANGERAWLVTGQSGDSSIIAVLYPLDSPAGAVVHGASFVFRGERVPVAITPVPSERTSVAWSTAVGRAGESGFVRFDEDGVIRIVAQ